MSANDEHMSLLHRIAGKPPNGGAASVVQRVGIRVLEGRVPAHIQVSERRTGRATGIIV